MGLRRGNILQIEVRCKKADDTQSLSHIWNNFDARDCAFRSTNMNRFFRETKLLIKAHPNDVMCSYRFAHVWA